MAAVRTLWLVGAMALVAIGCSPSPPAALPTQADPVVPSTATPTPLAAEPTPVPLSGGSYYKPPGWNGSADVDCKDFDTHAHAQSFFTSTGGSTTNDPYGLDGNHDADACETLP
jgi:hypothetical protein